MQVVFAALGRLLRWRVSAIAAGLLAACCAAVCGDAYAADSARGPDARVKSGTAFFVTAKGDLVTSAHVISGCPAISIFDRDGNQHPARVVALDRRLDLALMRTTDINPSHIDTIDPQNFSIGEEVHAIGYGVITRDPKRAVLSRGVYIGFGTTPAGTLVRVVRLRLREGESGGPVLTGSGALLGMAIGRYTDRPELGVLVPTRDIGDFLADHGIRPRPSPPLSANPHDVLLAISVLVQCLPAANG